MHIVVCMYVQYYANQKQPGAVKKAQQSKVESKVLLSSRAQPVAK